MPETSALRLQGDVNSLHVEGLNAIGPLEGQVLDYLWNHGESSVQDIYVEFGKGVPFGEHKSYTTILNTMTHLQRRGLLDRRLDETSKRTVYLYFPIVSEAEYARSIISKVLDALRYYHPGVLAELCTHA